MFVYSGPRLVCGAPRQQGRHVLEGGVQLTIQGLQVTALSNLI